MRLSYVSLGLISLLAACGGGGGGGTSATVGGTVTTPTPVALDATNYVAATTEAVSPSLAILDATTTAVGVEAKDINEGITFGLAQVPSLGKWFGGPSTAAGVVQTQSENCSGGGTITASVNDADNNGAVSTGDTATVTANNCNDGSSTFNGSITFSIATLTGDISSDNYNASLNATFNNFSASSAGRAVAVNGDLTLSASGSGFNKRAQSITASSLTSNATFGGTTFSRGLTNFSATYAKDPNSPTSVFKTTSSVSGTVSSSALNNRTVILATTTPFVRLSTNAFPSIGQGTLSGANASKVRLTAQNATTVLIELDANGDGTYETSTTKPWTELR